MILHRFCSLAEYDKYMAGETLVNTKDHGACRGYAATSAVGFCFFVEHPEKRKHQLSGIVDFDVCLTVEVDPSKVNLCHGRYPLRINGRFVGAENVMEYCTTSYNNKDFKLVKADKSFSGYAPNGSVFRELFPNLFL